MLQSHNTCAIETIKKCIRLLANTPGFEYGDIIVYVNIDNLYDVFCLFRKPRGL